MCPAKHGNGGRFIPVFFTDFVEDLFSSSPPSPFFCTCFALSKLTERFRAHCSYLHPPYIVHGFYMNWGFVRAAVMLPFTDIASQLAFPDKNGLPINVWGEKISWH